MAKRIRRDLSNKEIRRIVKEQLKENEPSQSNFKEPPKYKPIIFILIIILIAVLGYQFSDKIDFRGFLSFSQSDSLEAETVLNEPRNAKTSQKAAADTATIKAIPPVAQKLQIEVLNGCGVPGIAKKVTDYLRDNNIDVVYSGNYKNFNAKKSLVIARTKNKQDALKVAKTLHIAENYVSVAVDKNKELAASIILGKDYKKIKPFKKN